MTVVKIKDNSPTLDNILFPKYTYVDSYIVLENNMDNVGIVIDNKPYWFDKKYIEREI